MDRERRKKGYFLERESFGERKREDPKRLFHLGYQLNQRERESLNETFTVIQHISRWTSQYVNKEDSGGHNGNFTKSGEMRKGQK